jgi:hypothetical protein
MIATYATSLLTLATGTIALSATFLGNLYRGQDLWTLLVAWALLAASMVVAFLTLGQGISLLAESDLRPRHGLLEGMGLIHLILVLAGLAFFAVFAVQNSTHSAAPKSSPTTTQSTATGGHPPSTATGGHPASTATGGHPASTATGSYPTVTVPPTSPTIPSPSTEPGRG